MRKSGRVILLMLLILSQPATAQVLMEVPLLLQVHGQEHLIRAWYDGEAFLVDANELFQNLGFIVQIHGREFKALDTRHEHRLICAGLPETNSCKVPMQDVLKRLGSRLRFDETRLQLRASSVATTFDLRIPEAQQPPWSKRSAPHLFGHSRHLWGGMMASWHIRHDAHGVQPSLRVLSSALLGTIEAELGTRSAWSYRYAMPESKWLSQIAVNHEAASFSGITLTNIPLARQYLQHMRTFEGEATAYALVQARLSGELIDQVQADANGGYRLTTPKWYGTTTLEVRTQPLGGQREITHLYHFFTPASLVPSGHLYYRVHANREDYALELQYGLRHWWTLSSRFSRQHDRTDLTAAVTLTPVSYLAVEAELQYPAGRWHAGLELWRNQVQVRAQIDTKYSEYIHSSITASGRKGPLTLWLRGTQLTVARQIRQLMLAPAIWLHHRSGLLMQASWGIDHLHGPSRDLERHQRWRFAPGWSFSRARLLAFADRNVDHQVYGIEAMVIFRHQSLTFSAGWDADHDQVVGSVNVMITSGAGSLVARARRDARGITHAQYAQGSIHFGKRLNPSSSRHLGSAAELRIFEDKNRNGIQDEKEPLLPYITAQLSQSGWTLLKSGALYAAHLEPYQRYQVRLLEASIRDPLLHPATGFEFSFTADPGQRKLIHIPMQYLVPVMGTITGLDRAPLRLQILVDQEDTAEVYRDGGFTLHLLPGTYTLLVADRLTQEILAEQMIKVTKEPHHVVINLDQDMP